MAEEEEEEIVASGEALRTVAGWLGVGEGDVDSVMENEGLNPEFEAGRTQGLGLGAKFLPHNKAVGLTAGVERRLGSKLKRSVQTPAGVRAHMGFAAAGQHGRAGQHPHHAHAHSRHQPQQQEAAAAEEEEDSEEEGRGGAFSKGGRGDTRRPAVLSRGELLKVSGAAVAGKKRRRKSGGGTGGGGAAGGGGG